MNPTPFTPKPALRATVPTPDEKAQAGHNAGNPGHDSPNHDSPNHDSPNHDSPNHDSPNHDSRGHHTHQAHRTLSPADAAPASPALRSGPLVTSALGWPAWLRVLAVLPVIVLLWLAVGWASAEVAPW